MTTKALAGGTIHELPADFRRALAADAAAKSLWADITPLARNEWICWVTSGKKEETRKHRIEVGLDKMREECADRAVGPAVRTAEVCFHEITDAHVARQVSMPDGLRPAGSTFARFARPRSVRALGLMIKLNVVIAAVLGIALAVGESIRRFGTDSWPPFVVDDYIMCILLCLGAWRAYRSTFTDLRLLLAGWSFTSGMLYLSFFANLERYMTNAPDSGISSPIWVLLIFIAFVTSLLGAFHTLRAMKTSN